MNLLAHVPEHQRDAIYFIDMKIAHLEGQIKRLKNARFELGGDLDSVPEPEPVKPVKKIVVDVNPEMNGEHTSASSKRPPGALVEEICDLLYKSGPLTIYNMCELLGTQYQSVLNALHRRNSPFVQCGTEPRVGFAKPRSLWFLTDAYVAERKAKEMAEGEE